ncbi:MAG: acyl-CoA-binding protein [Lysobacterales bacterium]
MSDLGKRFDQAQAEAKTLTERPDDSVLLRLYALYKQGSEGDITGQRPGFFDFKGGAKFDAWEKLKGTAKATAQQQYVDLVTKLAR